MTVITSAITRLCRSMIGANTALLWLIACCALVAPTQAAPGAEIVAVQRQIEKARSQLNVSPEAAISIAEEAAKFANQNLSKSDRDTLLSESDAVVSRALIGLKRIDEADLVIKRAFSRAKISQIAPKVIGELTLAKGRIAQHRDNVQSALSAFQQAYGIFRSAGEKRSQALALQSIAKLYVDGGDGENAIRYYAQSDDEYHGDPLMSLSSRNNRGMAYLLLLKPREAELEFKRALQIADEIGSEKYKTRILSNIAQTQIGQRRFVDASATIDQALLSIQVNDNGDEAWRLWWMKAQVASARKDWPAATSAIERALTGVDPQTSAAAYRDAHRDAYKIYRATGRVNLALIHAEAAWRLDEETAKLTANNSAALMAARFDFANQNTRIAQLKAKELELQRNFLIAVIAGGALALLLLSVSLILIIRSRNRERSAKLLLAQTNRDLEKAIAAKMEFLATTSHEIRTPLNGILGMTQVMLSDRQLEVTLRDRIGIVHDAGEAMRALVDDILDVAKMETGQLAVGSGTVDLKATLQQVAQVWRLQAEAAGVELALGLDDCPDRIEGDAGRIRQIVFNLLSNAMKFTEKGKVELAARATDGDGGKRIQISVRDSGIGIASEWHESIFELFQQVDGGTTRKYGGTGLGLAICRNLARAMGGDISVESEVGFGSTFTVDLPLAVPPTVIPSRPAAHRPTTTVLVIEHNPLTRGMMRAILSARFEVVAFVNDVAEACNYLALEEVDWIVADASSVDDFTRLFRATDRPVALVEGADPIAGEVRERARVVLAKPLTKTALLNVFVETDETVAVAA
jgi:signal transduction histidine kinase/CheY-like chemotaxis protein